MDIIAAVRGVIQDLVVTEFKSLQQEVRSLREDTNRRFNEVDARLDALEKQVAQMMEVRMHEEVERLRQEMRLSERVAKLEAVVFGAKGQETE